MRPVPKILATFFGLGYFPVAPGTLASLVAALLYKFLLFRLAWPVLAALVVALFLVGVAAAAVTARDLGDPDPSVVVIDEVCGQTATLLLVPATWVWVAAGFVLFRLFDVWKPFPIRRLERLPGGWGIMADDMAAAVAAALVLHLAFAVGGTRLT